MEYDDDRQHNLADLTLTYLDNPENGGHPYEITAETPATCTSDGEKTYTCVCGDTYTEVLPGGHDYIVDPNMPEVPPTCGSVGKRYYICTRCGDETAEMIPQGGEHYYRWGLDHAPTATEPGLKWERCVYCGTKTGWVIPATGFEWDESMIIDFLTYTVTGLNPGLTSLESLTNVVKDNCVWTYDTAYSRLGTGSKAILMHGDEVVQEYTILIYGDVDGNGWRDANDAFLVNMIANGLIDPYYLDETVRKAADCNRDDIINELDFEMLVWAALKLDEIDMNASHAELVTQTAYIEYLSIFDQSFTPDIAPEADGTTDDDNVENGTDGSVTGIEAIITRIFEFIKKILSFIFSAIV